MSFEEYSASYKRGGSDIVSIQKSGAIYFSKKTKFSIGCSSRAKVLIDTANKKVKLINITSAEESAVPKKTTLAVSGQISGCSISALGFLHKLGFDSRTQKLRAIIEEDTPSFIIFSVVVDDDDINSKPNKREPLKDDEIEIWNHKIDIMQKELFAQEQIMSDLIGIKHDLNLGAALGFIRKASDELNNITS